MGVYCIVLSTGSVAGMMGREAPLCCSAIIRRTKHYIITNTTYKYHVHAMSKQVCYKRKQSQMRYKAGKH